MAVVQDIKNLVATNSLSFEKRLEFKANVRPRPSMQIRQTSKDKNKEVHRNFKDSMYDLSDWICGCEVTNKFYCFICLLFANDSVWCKNGVTDLKHLKEKVKKHSLSADHMKNCINYATLSRVDIRLQLDSAYRKSIEDYNVNVRENRYILNQIIDCVKFSGAFELALRGYDETESSKNDGMLWGPINFVSELDSIFNSHLEQNTVFKGISKTMQNDLLDSMLVIIQQKIKSEIDRSDFISIQVETIDNSNETQMVFILRYVLNGIIYERFLKIVHPPSPNSQEITSAILRELEILEINKNPEKLIAQSYDAASPMSGKLGGVQTKIKQLYPAANFIHSYAHQLNFILQKAVSQDRTLRIFFANLHGFSSFFGQSSRRTAVLDAVVKSRLTDSAPMGWYFNSRCVETVYSHQTDILACLTLILDKEEDANTINQAIALKSFLQNKNFLYWLKFFHTIMPHCEVLSNQLQKRGIDAISLKIDIANFKNSILKIRNEVLSDETLRQDFILSSNTKRNRSHVTKRQTSLEVCDILLAEIQNRFSFSDHLIMAQLFYSDQFEEFNHKFPDVILKLVKKHFTFINDAKLKTELEVIYDQEDFRDNVGAVAILQLFINNNLGETFSESVKLLKLLCTLPMTTIESERCFPTLQKIKTFLRNTRDNTTGQEKLCALAMLTIEKSFIENITNFNELVIDHFVNSKDPQIDLIYKSL